jgi:quercetin dioxygenase-like cupin family protein
MSSYKLLLPAAILGLSISALTRAAEPEQTGITAQQLASEKLANAPDKAFTALEVTVAPHGRATPHHHAGFVFAYVKSGEIRSQVTGQSEPHLYRAGQSWVEEPGVTHEVFENPSATKPVKLLVIWVADEGAPLTTFSK